MKWILPLATVALLASCTTKPWMVGSANDQFPLHPPKPGSSLNQTPDCGGCGHCAECEAEKQSLNQDREPGNLFRHP